MNLSGLKETLIPQLQKSVKISSNELNLNYRRISGDLIKVGIPQVLVKPGFICLKEPAKGFYCRSEEENSHCL